MQKFYKNFKYFLIGYWLFFIAFQGIVCASMIDDFNNGLSGWTIQQNPDDVIANPNGEPVITIKNSNVGMTWLTSNTIGSVNDFDIAVSFVGSPVINGNDSFGLIFGFQNINNYYLAYVFPGFPQSAFRLEKVVNGSLTTVYTDSNANHPVGFTFSTGSESTIKPDALRIKRVGNSFEAFVADSVTTGWQSFSGSTWTDNSFGAGLVGFGKRYDLSTTEPIGTRFAVFGEGSTGIDAVLQSTDFALSQSNFSINVPETNSFVFLLIFLLIFLRRSII